MPDPLPQHEMDTLVALHALDALLPDERALVESAVASDPRLADELAAYRAVAAVLAESVETAPPTPSPDVWRSIRSAIEGPDLPASGLAPIVDLRRQRLWSRLSTVVAVAAVAVAVALGVRLVDVQNEVNRADVAQLAAEKATEPGSQVVTLAATEGHAGEQARIVLGADGLGYVLSHTLPKLPDDRTYQLWVIVRGGEESRVISAGVLGNDPGVSQFQTVGDVIGFAITDEVAGGVPISGGETVALWAGNG